jgi:putative SOS response-associated peptidase YedK
MCGRYELHSHPAAIALAFGLARPPDVHARYNIAPMTDVPVVRINVEGKRELVRMRWGLVPRWAKDPSIGAKMINARAETLAAKPAFRTAYRRHRCLLPANGFYEWHEVPAAHPPKEPLHIGMKDGGLFALAGLYERWLSNDGDVVDSCTIVTTEANALIRSFHDRMPVIVAPERYGEWLDPALPQADALLVPYSADAMLCFPVSTRVNSVRNDDESLIRPAQGASAAAVAPMPPGPPGPPAHDPEQESLF